MKPLRLKALGNEDKTLVLVIFENNPKHILRKITATNYCVNKVISLDFV